MPENEIKEIADKADMIITGYAYTKVENQIRVLNLNDTHEACVLSIDGEMQSTNMDEVTLALVQAYYLKNKQFMEGNDA